MPQYLSPGVYVEEVPSAIKAIAGVSTSTAGFIGVVPDSLPMPGASTAITGEAIGTGDGTKTDFNLKKYPVLTTAGSFQIRVKDAPVTTATLSNDDVKKVSKVTFSTAPADKAAISGDYVQTDTFAPVAASEPLDSAHVEPNPLRRQRRSPDRLPGGRERPAGCGVRIRLGRQPRVGVGEPPD